MAKSAHLSDSVPNEGCSRSLIMPTVNGPRPSPRRFNTKNRIAEVRALILAGTIECATDMAGPRYIL